METPDISWLPQIGLVPLPEELVAVALAALRQASPKPWTAAKAKKGLFRGVNLSSSLKGVLVHPQIIPPAYRILVVDETTQHIYLPTERAEDLVGLCRQLYDVTLSTVVIFNEFCRQEFGLVGKNTPAIRLLSAADMGSVGLDASVQRLVAAGSNESFWWQRWGGELFKIKYEHGEKGPVFVRQTIRHRVGKFDWPPAGVSR